MSAKTGQQSVPDIDSERVDNAKPAHRPPTARSQSIRSANSEPPKPKVPVSLARRLLFPSLPPSAPLPPILTLGLDGSDPALVELNTELYDFLALTLRAFVQTWWSQLTPRDRDLLPQITRVLTHVMQDIEQRASNVDFASLALRQIPTLVDLHINDYRAAAIRIDTNFTNISPPPTVSGIFRLLQPHVAIQPTQEGNAIISEIYLRQLVENILRLSLPQQDWGSEAERFIVREIVACVVLSNALRKLAQPWFLHQIIFGLLKPRSSAQSEVSMGPHSNMLHTRISPQVHRIFHAFSQPFIPDHRHIRVLRDANNIWRCLGHYLDVPVYCWPDACCESLSRTSHSPERETCRRFRVFA